MSDDFDMQQQVSGDDHIPVRPSIDGQRCMTEHLEAPPVPSLPAQFRSRRKKSGDVLRQSISRVSADVSSDLRMEAWRAC